MRNSAEYAVETDPEVHAVVRRLIDAPLLSRVPRGPSRALIFLAHRFADAELREDAWLKELIATEHDAAIFARDVRGIGESKPVLSTPEPPAKGGIEYFHAVFGLMFDYPTGGQRTHDTLRVLDWLRETGHREAHLVALGWGAIPATFAAVLHESNASDAQACTEEFRRGGRG